jgi:hypothetical protein
MQVDDQRGDPRGAFAGLVRAPLPFQLCSGERRGTGASILVLLPESVFLPASWLLPHLQSCELVVQFILVN